ncbi:MAG: hypothetical protein DMG94_12395, partial [Acidobacteria bacterium]
YVKLAIVSGAPNQSHKAASDKGTLRQFFAGLILQLSGRVRVTRLLTFDKLPLAHFKSSFTSFTIRP